MKVKRLGVLGIVIFILLLPSLLAQDFNVEVTSDSVETCKGAQRVEIIRVSNTGSVPYLFTISGKGVASSFTGYAPSSFVLEPGQSQDVYMHILPPIDARKSYVLTTVLTTNTGLVKTIEQNVNVGTCLNQFLTLEQY